jgi:hypothetical protein
MSVVDELVTILGIDLDAAALSKLDAFNKGMEKAEKFAIKAAVAVTAATTAFTYWLKTTSKNSESLVRLSDMTGVSTDEIQKLSYSVEHLGGSADSLKNDILNLQKTMTSPIPGQFNENLLMLGVATKNSQGGVRAVADVVDDLAERFGKMNSQQALQWGSKLGLSQDTIRLLQQGREGVDKLKKQAEQLGGIIPNEALRQSIKFNQGLKDIWFSLKGITAQIGLALLPSLSRGIDKFREWLKVNQEIIKLRLGEFISGASVGLERFWNVLVKIKNVATEYVQKIFAALGITTDLKNVSEGLTAGLTIGLLAILGIWSAMHSSIALVIAATTAVGLVIEDIISFFSGGKSVIGEFFESFEEHFPALYDFFGWLKDMIGSGLVAAFKLLGSISKGVLQGIKDLLGDIMKIVEWVLKKAGFGTEESKAGRKERKKKIIEGADAGAMLIDSLSRQDQINRMAVGDKKLQNNNTVNNNQKVDINVQGTANPQQTANIIFEKLSWMPIGQFAPVAG